MGQMSSLAENVDDIANDSTIFMMRSIHLEECS